MDATRMAVRTYVIALGSAGDEAFCAGADLQHSGAAFVFDYGRGSDRLTRIGLQSRGLDA